MQPKAFVTTLALSLLGLSVLNTVANLLLTKSLGAPAILSFAINLVLAIFMIRGANWARWVTLACLIISIIISLCEWLYLDSNVLSFGTLLFVRLVSGAGILFFAYVAVNLLLSKRVNEHFGT
jgi:hypothetical protein